MNPNLSKVTMHLHLFWTNYPKHLYKPLIVSNGKQTTWASVCMNWCLFIPATHVHSRALSSCTYSTLPGYRTVWMQQVINWHMQIHEVRSNQLHLGLMCLLLFFPYFLVIVIGINGLSDLIMGIVMALNAETPEVNALTPRWCVNYFVCSCKSICWKLAKEQKEKQPIVSNSCTFRHWRNSSPCKKENLRAKWFLMWTKCW